MKTSKKITIGIASMIMGFAATMLVAGQVQASDGGKWQKQNPVFDEDGEVIGVVDPNVDCESYASTQSGQEVYFCTSEDKDD